VVGSGRAGGGSHGGEQFDRRKRGFACGFFFFSSTFSSSFLSLDEARGGGISSVK